MNSAVELPFWLLLFFLVLSYVTLLSLLVELSYHLCSVTFVKMAQVFLEEITCAWIGEHPGKWPTGLSRK